MFLKIIKKLFNKKNNYISKEIKNIVYNINNLENYFSKLTNDQLKKKLNFLEIV
ncbi:hypothetical protein [Buchnera aphidicola]|uniref:hypothetical protein n=1 Tax=Buchnera aphidicola TaxID=9 RepID=UPI0021C5CB00|nr:hypothetical protein [Buchnera aphidicola]